MKFIHARPTVTSDPARFTGEAWADQIALPQEGDQRMHVAHVRFSPGSRTAWHSHARGQFLLVTRGVALVGTRDGLVIAAQAGDTVYTPPGEEHWHGATPDVFMEHLAMFESGDDPATTSTWAEKVSDDEYHKPSVTRVADPA